MNLNIRSGVVNYNNKILIFDSQFVLRKNDENNTLELAKEAIISKIGHKDIKVVVRQTITHEDSTQKQTITHEEEKVALIISMAGVFAIWNMFR